VFALIAFTFALLSRMGEIIDIQRRIREVGRIRLGVQGTTAEGKRYPKKINRFRFTSGDEAIINATAQRYGGTARGWQNDDRDEFEVVSDATEIPIMLPPNPTDLGFSQWFEVWGNKVCKKRCDGVRDQVRDVPCDCDPDERECKATTRLSVILPEIPGLGVWRVESHGWNAAVELAASVEMIEALAGRQAMVPARLRLDVREQRRLIDGEAKTRKFVVPVIDVDVSVNQVQALVAGPPPAAAVAAGSRSTDKEPTPPPTGWQKVPTAEPPAALTIESQIAETAKAVPAPARKKTQAPLPGSGRPPRTAAERAKGNGAVRHGTAPSVDVSEGCALCHEPLAGEPLKRNATGLPGRYAHVRCIEELERETAEERRAEEGGEGEPDQPASPPHEGAEDGDRGGTNGEPEASSGAALPEPAVEPPPVASGQSRAASKMPTAKMHSHIFGLLRDVMPVAPGSKTSPDDVRRDFEMGLCAAVGAPGLTSHKQITFETATLLIDALQGIKDGNLRWDPPSDDGPGRLLAAETGEIVDFGEPFE
jgi:hypothetical protein